MEARKYPTPPFPPQDIEPPGLEYKMDPAPQFRNPDYKGSGKLKNKVALITGGDSGIGRAVGVLFAREGADVALLHLPEEQKDAEITRQVIEQEEGQRALLVSGDVCDSAFCRNAVEQVADHFGKINLLVNNAAYQNHLKSIDQLSEEQWDRTFKTNIYGYFYMVKYALPYMPDGSAIINTGSILGLEGSSSLLDYSATKGAIHAFTKALAQQLVPRRIRVNCVAPGPVWTPLNPAEREHEEVKDFGADVPYKRPAQPEEIAPAFVFFASEKDSRYITGEVLTLLGGQTVA